MYKISNWEKIIDYGYLPAYKGFIYWFFNKETKFAELVLYDANLPKKYFTDRYSHWILPNTPIF